MNLTALHDDIAQWYRHQGRQDLPWRNTDDPYHVYLSEIMLQQTQVETVRTRFYPKFLEQFPTLLDLAQADEEHVLKSWEGLGYYRRASYLHRAAGMLCKQGGRVPNDKKALMALPGIGQNTAHAILSFAFHQPYPVMEANVARILRRFFAHLSVSDSMLWNHAWTLLDQTRPFVYNQAMMDIGAMICRVKEPQCSLCPLSKECQGQDDPLRYNKSKNKKLLPVRRMYALVYQDSSRVIWIGKRRSKFLQGFYGVPFVSMDQPLPDEAEYIGEVSCRYSHFMYQISCYLLPRHALVHESDEVMEWKSLDEIEQLPLSRIDRMILALID